MMNSGKYNLSNSDSVQPGPDASAEEWKSAYVQKTQELGFVAEIGTKLLEKLQVAEQKIKQMEEQSTDSSREVDKLKRTVSTLTIDKNRLENVLKEFETTNWALVEDLKKQEDMIKKQKSMSKRRETEQDEIRNEVEDVKEELMKQKEIEQELRKELGRLKKEISSQQDDHRKELSRTMSLTKFKKLQADNQKFQDEFNALQNQLNEANSQIRTLKDLLEDAEQQKMEFQDMVHTSHKMLEKERKEKQQLVESELTAKMELERQIDKLQFEMAKLESGTVSVVPNEEDAKRSILFEIQNEINRTGPQMPNRDDLKMKQEYFELTASALKVRLSLSTKTEYAFMVPVSNFFTEAVSDGIPFHEWYPWLKRKLLDGSEKLRLEFEPPEVKPPPPVVAVSSKETKKVETPPAEEKSLKSILFSPLRRNKERALSSPVSPPVNPSNPEKKKEKEKAADTKR